MSKTILLFMLLFSTTLAFGQAEKKPQKEIPVVEKTHPEAAQTGAGISNMGTTQEGGKQKGISISSAARRRSLVNTKAGSVSEGAERGRANGQTGAEVSNNARNIRPSQSGRPSNPGRPGITVPSARPTPPVVRPNKPRPNRPGPGNVPNPPGKPGGL
ncbi:hypothetical protein [Negadavirga shengliensis]|uniref:Translation initiation factor IF-2 n=1 Tax=Negadavirga shengliensis TaxID=1389218 RepID=A0ABV9SVQ6_9BACT